MMAQPPHPPTWPPQSPQSPQQPSRPLGGAAVAAVAIAAAIPTALFYLPLLEVAHARPGSGAFWGALVGIGLLLFVVEALAFAAIARNMAWGCLAFVIPELIVPYFAIRTVLTYYRNSQTTPRDQLGQLWQSYRSKARNAQIAIGAGAIIATLALCSGVGSVFASGGIVTDAATPTVAAQVAQAPTNTPDTSGPIITSPTDTPIPPTATPQPTATATPKPAPTATPRPLPPTATPAPSCTGVNGNPWCYDFNPGNLIYSPPGAFCNYFSCIGNFWNGRGYVVECNDGMYSKSGGIQGACSYHQGVMRPLYSH